MPEERAVFASDEHHVLRLFAGGRARLAAEAECDALDATAMESTGPWRATDGAVERPARAPPTRIDAAAADGQDSRFGVETLKRKLIINSW